ncbi:amino acid permease-domain-containing protein [Aspergillus varians]
MASRNSNDHHGFDLNELDWFPQARARQPSSTSFGGTLPTLRRSSSPELYCSISGPSERPSERPPERQDVEDMGTQFVISNYEADRTVKRRLRGIHVFMITISGVLGAGLYIRSGTVLRVGGPGAVLIAFTVMGLLAWTVMQCIGEFLALWPISGALVEFVAKFVDEDLGTAVGIAYWFTYSINFAALIVAAAGVLDYWDPGKALQGTVVFVVVPLLLVIMNNFGVQIYGLTELIGGSIKILGIFIVIVCMIAINLGAGEEGHIGTKNYKHGPMFPHDDTAVNNWASALFYAFSIAAFAYVGVDITAATALEVRPDRRRRFSGDSEHPETDPVNISRWPDISVRFVATWTSFLVWIIYSIAGCLMTLNVRWDDKNLPRLSWLGSPVQGEDPGEKIYKTDSGFVISAALSKIPGLAGIFTALIFTTAVFSANTNLYVASRTLFGLTRRLQESKWSWLAFFGKTNSYQVPTRAMFLSCCFLWVPFMYLSPHNSSDTTIANLLEVLSQMGSVSCIIVWACECWAFIRFYRCLYRHRDEINTSEEFARLRRWRNGGERDLYPWRSHGQPVTMYVALFGCLFVLAVADGAALWHNWATPRFLSAYLAIICFIPLWLGIKCYSNWGNVQWKLEDLSNFTYVQQKLRQLNEIHDLATTRDTGAPEPRGWRNLWGVM